MERPSRGSDALTFIIGLHANRTRVRTTETVVQAGRSLGKAPKKASCIHMFDCFNQPMVWLSHNLHQRVALPKVQPCRLPFGRCSRRSSVRSSSPIPSSDRVVFPTHRCGGRLMDQFVADRSLLHPLWASEESSERSTCI